MRLTEKAETSASYTICTMSKYYNPHQRKSRESILNNSIENIFNTLQQSDIPGYIIKKM
jgi:hypothetical protein